MASEERFSNCGLKNQLFTSSMQVIHGEVLQQLRRAVLDLVVDSYLSDDRKQVLFDLRWIV